MAISFIETPQLILRDWQESGTLKPDDIYSFTSVHNTRSEKVMINTGMTKEGEFDHPLIEDGHPLKRRVLYKVSNNVMPVSLY